MYTVAIPPQPKHRLIAQSLIFQKQTRRVYEILRLKATNCSDAKEYANYRVDIKRRLNLPFQVGALKAEFCCYLPGSKVRLREHLVLIDCLGPASVDFIRDILRVHGGFY